MLLEDHSTQLHGHLSLLETESILSYDLPSEAPSADNQHQVKDNAHDKK